jgi:hypothetical protein
MRSTIRAGLLASALALGGIALLPVPSFGAAYADASISFDSFHSQLADQGDWFYSDRWGMVWQPYDAYDDWRPYSRGHWVNTYEYGWLWSSDDSFGDITSHYGRWVNDPDDGWLWLPGYVWSPAWVVWRQSGDQTGWMPMPPDQRFLDGDEFNARPGTSVNIGFNTWDGSSDYYGYARWYGGAYSQDRFAGLWTFVPVQHFADRDYRRYVVRRDTLSDVVRRSRNVTNYTIVNNYIVNRSVDVKVVYRGRREPVRVVRAADVIHRPSLVARLDIGRNVSLRMRVDMPRGHGTANSAPRPTRRQVDALAPANKDRGRNPAAVQARNPNRHHLLDRNAAEVVVRPNGSAPAALTTTDIEKAKSKAPATVPAQNAKSGADNGKTSADQTPQNGPGKAKGNKKDKANGDNGAASGNANGAQPNPGTPPDNGAERKRNPRGDKTAPDNGNAATPGGTAAPNATDTKAERQAKKRAKQTEDNNGNTTTTQPASPDATQPTRPRRDRSQAPDNAMTTQPASPDATPPTRPHRDRSQTPDNAMTTQPASPDATPPTRPHRDRSQTPDNAMTTQPASPDATPPTRPHRDRSATPDSSGAMTAPQASPSGPTPDDRAERRRARAQGNAPDQSSSQMSGPSASPPADSGDQPKKPKHKPDAPQ